MESLVGQRGPRTTTPPPLRIANPMDVFVPQKYTVSPSALGGGSVSVNGRFWVTSKVSFRGGARAGESQTGGGQRGELNGGAKEKSKVIKV